MHPLLTDIKTFILDTLFPIECIHCGSDGEFICALCLAGFKKLTTQYCIECQKPAPWGVTHPSCKTKASADALLSVYDYHDKKVAKSIIDGKYNFISTIFIIFGKTMAHWLHNQKLDIPLSGFIITSLPLSPSRERWRGFNQANLLCSEISKYLNLPTQPLLKKIKGTRVQKDLKKEDRMHNIKNAFDINLKWPKPWYESILNGPEGTYIPELIVKNKNILLIDDVITTGSTLKEAITTLKNHGAARVWSITLARD